jgi:hypothetical protein
VLAQEPAQVLLPQEEEVVVALEQVLLPQEAVVVVVALVHVLLPLLQARVLVRVLVPPLRVQVPALAPLRVLYSYALSRRDGVCDHLFYHDDAGPFPYDLRGLCAPCDNCRQILATPDW